MNKEKSVINPVKMIIEILLIVVSLAYLTSLIINKNNAKTFYLIAIFVSLFEIFIKNARFIYFRNSSRKAKILSLIVSFIAIFMLFSFFAQYIINSKTLVFGYINRYSIILLVLYLIFISIKCFRDLIKNKKNLLRNIILSILGLFSSFIICLCYYIIYIK